MYVIAIANTKGGVGKSTLTAALAVRAAKDSPRVAMVDLDPQRSVEEWWRRRGSSTNPCVFTGADSASDAVEALSRDGWDWVFIDGPPAFLSIIEDTLAVSDFALMPMKLSALDLLASHDAVVLARKVGADFMIVLNDVSPRDKMLKDAQQTLFTAGVKIAETVVYHRVAHRDAMTVGKTGAEVNNGRDKAAADEIDKLWGEVKAATIAAHKKRQKQGGGRD